MTGLPIMLATVTVFLVAGATALVSLWLGRLDILAKVVKLCLVWGAAYFSLLIGTSTQSEEVTLAHGQRKAFCGAYFDCHLGVTVKDVRHVAELRLVDTVWSTDDKFLFVYDEISSDAKEARMRLRNPRFVVIDEQGHTYERLEHLEYQFASRFGLPQSLSEPVSPGRPITKPLIFEVPKEARNLKLHATKGGPGERLSELFLIGDEDSLLHRPKLLSLDPPIAQNL